MSSSHITNDTYFWKSTKKRENQTHWIRNDCQSTQVQRNPKKRKVIAKFHIPILIIHLDVSISPTSSNRARPPKSPLRHNKSPNAAGSLKVSSSSSSSNRFRDQKRRPSAPIISNSSFIKDDESKNSFFTKPSDRKRHENSKSVIMEDEPVLEISESRRTSTITGGKLILLDDQGEIITNYVGWTQNLWCQYGLLTFIILIAIRKLYWKRSVWFSLQVNIGREGYMIYKQNHFRTLDLSTGEVVAIKRVKLEEEELYKEIMVCHYYYYTYLFIYSRYRKKWISWKIYHTPM